MWSPTPTHGLRKQPSYIQKTEEESNIGDYIQLLLVYSIVVITFRMLFNSLVATGLRCATVIHCFQSITLINNTFSCCEMHPVALDVFKRNWTR